MNTYKGTHLISIITVSFNSEETIRDTIESVINQTYSNIEYILIDGASKDSTVDIIKEYEPLAKDKGIDYKWVSEPDDGIYDAMNKGIKKASGMWVNFMNCGDTFYGTTIIEKIFSNNNYDEVGVIYGNHRVIYPKKTLIRMAGSVNNLWKGSQFCHQSTFISRAYHDNNLYNTSNKIGADFEFFYYFKKSGGVFRKLDIVVANYSAGGVSDIRRIDSIVGFWNVIDKTGKVNLYYIFRIITEIIKSFIKKLLNI